MHPAASSRKLLVGATTRGSLASQCAPSPRCKFRLGFSGLQARTDSITRLFFSFLLMWPYGSPLPPCIGLGCRIVEIACFSEDSYLYARTAMGRRRVMEPTPDMSFTRLRYSALQRFS
ncbi:hypothetical protein NDU88_007056 [Pleurodeles waltl]|uniref:Secreted protein n=1 Tax=Pleurodeles waltl TaxID=8319 RepID=A0AAV7UNB4_PLEWA|nr:hypothetical protein NDU88_007056 [Pleurodeles waltl]